jgi:nucleotide-binding universal stress UspA family protein
MFKHILIPLDGSKLAEAALPPAISLAQTLGSPVTLLHLVEKDAPQAVHGHRHLRQADEAEAYLQHLAHTAFPEGIKVEWHVHTTEIENVASSIVQHAEEIEPDLIVMCSHGGGGMRDALFGNIAQQVIGQCDVPLLLLKPADAPAPPFHIRKIFLPLDDESIHDESLSIAMPLAKAYNAALYLLTVIPTLGTLSDREAAAGTLLPATASAYLDIKEENAKEHLQEHLDELCHGGYDAEAEIARGDPVAVISETAERVSADLMILSTHRRSGTAAFWARSVAPSVARRVQMPLLLVPMEG